MKRKTKEIVKGICIGVLLLGSVGAYVWSIGISDKEEETTVPETTAVVASKPATQEEILADSTHELKEEAEIERLVWSVYSAKLVEDYDMLDDYYKNRPIFKDPKEELYMQTTDFAEETKYIVLEYSVFNNDTETKTIYPGKMKFYNRLDEAEFEVYYASDKIDGRCLDMPSFKTLEFAVEAVEIPAGENLKFEYVLQFNSYQSPIYDLYVSLNEASGSIINLGGAIAEQKVHLGIAPKLRSAYKAGVADSVQEARDIPLMKSRQWTNLEMKAYQVRPFPEPNNLAEGTEVAAEEVVEQGYEFVDHITTKITSSKVINWEEIPQEYQNRDALERMASRYESLYGHTKENLKLLVLDISYTAVNIPSDVIVSNRHMCEFYMRSFLYTREADGTRWVFGTMDDWLVTSNGTSPERTGHINIEKMQPGDTIILQAVYILPPDIYEQYDALYFDGGKPYGPDDDIPVAEIPLN